MNLQGIKKRIAKILVYTATSIIFLFIYSFLILQFPAVQRLMAQQYLARFSDITGFEVTIRAIRLSWFDRLVLDGVSIKDAEHNEMIAVKRLGVNYKIANLFEGNDINLDAINIDSARVFFTKIQESDSTLNLNINVFIKEINRKYGSGKKGGQSPKINLGEAIITNSSFAYDNTGKDSLAGFDYHHFSLGIHEAELQNFVALGDTVEFNVGVLHAVDSKTNFGIQELSTFFRISQQALEFQGIHLKAGQSTISDTVIFQYESQADLNNFVNQVRINAHLSNTIIHPEDLALFAPAVKRLHDPIALTGHIRGRVNNFRFTNMEVKTGNTELQGSVSMDGLPDFKETFIVLNLKKSRIHFNDLDFLFNDNTAQRLRALGSLSLNAEFVGYPTDFVAKGDFSNTLGRIISDINLKIDEEQLERSQYNGQIAMIDFNLGQYLNDTTTYQKVNLDGRISGSGFTMNTARFTLVSSIQSIGILGYTYKNILTDASFSSRFFNGEVKIDDPHVKIQAKGSVDLRNNNNSINLQAKIDSVSLHDINLSKKRLFIHADVAINTKGFQLDSLSGNARITNLNVNYENRWLHLDQATLEAKKEGRERDLIFQSDVVDVKAAGDFYFSRLFNDIQELLHEFYLNINNDKTATETYYAAKRKGLDEYEADFVVKLKNLKPVTHLLNLDLQVKQNINVNGKFNSGNTTIIHAFAMIDSLRYQNVFLKNTEVEINASKLYTTPEALVMVYVSSAEQNIGNINTKNFSTEAIWNKSHIDFKVRVDQQTRNNYMRLNGVVDLLDSTEIRFSETSRIQLLEKTWTIDTTNLIKVLGKEWSVQHFKWTNEQQAVAVSGAVSSNPEKKISLSVENFNLSTINSLTQEELSGIVNAKVTVTNLYDQFTIQNEIDILDLKVDNFLVGNVTGNNVWNAEERKFQLEFLIDRLNQRIVNCSGYYNPSDKNNPLSVTARLVKANLKIIEPFINQILSNFDGTLSGVYSISGKLNNLNLSGKGELENARLLVNYLKTTYQVSGTIGLRPNAIFFENIELSDPLNNKGKLQGAITHQNFRQMKIKLDGEFENLHLLNTSARDNDLFYGQGYASGNVSFEGPLNNLKISANATTKKNTRVFIPIAGSTTAERKDFINFVNFTDSAYTGEVVTEVSKKVNLTGVTFDLNLDVTPDAYCEIIFDIKAGDIIRGRGNGRINLQLDTKGEFNMFGPVTFTEGGYNFTLYDIINKEFKIEPGSSIAWYGDPYQGIMKINASYNQLASLSPILPLTEAQLNSPQVRRKYPVQVLLTLEGPMLSPDINFDITGKELPKTVLLQDGSTIRIDDQFQVFKNKLDEQELKRQVFSLIVLRKFSPPESFNTSGSIVSSVSELFSNQLSYWMSQVDENLEIDVDLGSMDQESFNAFQLRLSYTFLNGRLRITRDGTFGNQPNSTTTENNRANYSSAVGDWTVDYLLTPDGKLKVKMYSRTNINPINNTLNSQNTITTGVSLLYTQSFNEIKDLLKSSRDKNRRKPEDEEEASENNGNEGGE